MPQAVEQGERAQEDDEGLIQLLVGSAFLQQVEIDHCLIVAGTFSQAVVVWFAYLHFDVIDGVLVIFDVDVETDALAVVLMGSV